MGVFENIALLFVITGIGLIVTAMLSVKTPIGLRKICLLLNEKVKHEVSKLTFELFKTSGLRFTGVNRKNNVRMLTI